jgi:hypothetical protein
MSISAMLHSTGRRDRLLAQRTRSSAGSIWPQLPSDRKQPLTRRVLIALDETGRLACAQIGERTGWWLATSAKRCGAVASTFDRDLDPAARVAGTRLARSFPMAAAPRNAEFRAATGFEGNPASSTVGDRPRNQRRTRQDLTIWRNGRQAVYQDLCGSFANTSA